MKTRRRKFLCNVAASGLGLCCGWPMTARARDTDSRPNILLILTDQERQNIPHRYLHLPNRKRLQSRGMTFTNAFCATPQCSASRANLLTGRYPTQAGVTQNMLQRNWDGAQQALSPSIPNFGSLLHEAGYQTGYIGKWHLLEERPPKENGLWEYGFETYQFARHDKAAQLAAEWIGERQSVPWCLTVSFIDPHDIYAIRNKAEYPIRPHAKALSNTHDDLSQKPPPQEKFLKDDQGKFSVNYKDEDWRRYLSYYYDLIEALDRYIGTILTSLQTTGQSENTVVIYSSDHGDLGGAHGLPFKGPCMYEELLNIPLILSWPAQVKKALVSDKLVQLGDLLPTFCTLAGCTPPNSLYGKNLSPLLQQSPVEWRDAIFAEYCGKQQWVEPIRTIRTKAFKYNDYINGHEELYDLDHDPGELRNLVGEYQYREIRNELRNRLTAWRMSIEDPTL